MSTAVVSRRLRIIESSGVTIVVRVLRIWEARNFHRDRALMSLDCVLLDEKDGVIQGSIPTKYIEQFRGDIKEGGVFAISNFDVAASGARYKLTDHRCMIRFTEETNIKKFDEAKHPIGLEKFRFRSNKEFLELANKGEELPDIIGHLCDHIRKPTDRVEGVTRRVVLRLRLQDGTKVRVTIWDEMVDALFEKYTETREDSIIMIINSVNPKMFGSDLFLNTTSSTKFYLNPDFPIVREFRERTKKKAQEITIVRGEGNTALSRATKNISEILGYLLEGNKKETEFICGATVKDIGVQNGWSYVACSACSKKIDKINTKLSCTKCNNPQAIGILRFRIEAVVEDSSGKTTFIIFDREANKIIGKTATEIMNEEDSSQEGSNENKKETETVPECVNSIVGRTFTFQIKVTNYNFTAQRQSFTVSRIVGENREESEKIVLGDGEKPKVHKREGADQSQMIDLAGKGTPETMIRNAANEGPKDKKIKKEDTSEDVKYTGLGEKSNGKGIVQPS